MDKSIEEACATVLSLGMDGNEHLIALKGQERILCKDGDNESVYVGTEIDAGLLRGVETIVHNHPDLSPLSGPDLRLAESLGCEVVVITLDGSIYSAKILQRGIYTNRQFLWNIMSEPFRLALRELSCTEGEAVVVLGHLTNIVLHEERLINYTYVMQEQTKLLLEKFKRLGIV